MAKVGETPVLTGPNLDKDIGHGLTSRGVHDAHIDKHRHADVASDNIVSNRLDETRACLSKGVR